MTKGSTSSGAPTSCVLDDGLMLAPGALCLIHGTWKVDPVQFGWQVVARRLAEGRETLVHAITPAQAQITNHRIRDAAGSQASSEMYERLNCATVNYLSRGNLVAGLSAGARRGGIIFLPGWDMLTAMGMNEAEDIAAMASLARHTGATVLIAGGYRNQDEAFTHERFATTWRQHSDERIRLTQGVLIEGENLTVPYRLTRDDSATNGTFWLNRRSGHYRNPSQPRASVVPMPGHEQRITELRFGNTCA